MRASSVPNIIHKNSTSHIESASVDLKPLLRSFNRPVIGRIPLAITQPLRRSENGTITLKIKNREANMVPIMAYISLGV